MLWILSFRMRLHIGRLTSVSSFCIMLIFGVCVASGITGFFEAWWMVGSEEMHR